MEIISSDRTGVHFPPTTVSFPGSTVGDVRGHQRRLARAVPAHLRGDRHAEHASTFAESVGRA